ncbi:MAG: hypothetical protein ACYC3W_09325 [Candidatus Nanopelagicales bacterium]
MPVRYLLKGLIMHCTLKESDINHLRRLIGWVACEVGQTPEELIASLRNLESVIDSIDEEAKDRLILAHKKAESVPKYVRDAIKALSKVIKPYQGNIVDADLVTQRALPDNQNSMKTSL